MRSAASVGADIGRFRAQTVSAEHWDRFAADIAWASPQQRAGWGQAVAGSFPFITVNYLIFFAGDRPVAGIPLMRFSAGGVLRSIQSSAFGSAGGPLIVDEFVECDGLYRAITGAIDDHARREHAFEASVILPPTAPAPLADRFSMMGAASAVRRNCPLLDLSPSMETIRANYNASVRRAVRKAQKEGVKVVAGADIALVEQGFGLYRGTMERIGGTVKPWPFIRSLLQNGIATAFVALHEGVPVGLVILLTTEHVALYWISASAAEASQLRPTNALIDHALQWCHDRGMATFSFGESPGERSSLEQFKLGWGSEIATTLEWRRVYRPLVKRAWETMEPAARKFYGLIKGAGGGQPRDQR